MTTALFLSLTLGLGGALPDQPAPRTQEALSPIPDSAEPRGILWTPWADRLAWSPTKQSSGAESKASPPLLGIELEPGEVLPGVARPIKDVWLSFPIDGTLVEIAVREGEVVSAGKLLARLDDALPKAAVAAAKAAATRTAGLATARLEAALARSFLSRIERSNALGATSDAALDEARSRFDKAKTLEKAESERLHQAELNREIEEIRLERHRMLAPFPATVVEVAVTSGQTLTPTTPTLHLIATDTLRVELHLPARLHGKLEIEGRFQLQAGDPINAPLTAILRNCDQLLDPRTGTFRCVFEIDNKDSRLPAGFTVTPSVTP